MVAHYQILVQIGDVYQITLPVSYRRIISAFKVVQFRVGFLTLSCFVGPTEFSQLLFVSFSPIIVSAIALLVSFVRRRSLLPALPFVLGLVFLVFPSVSSRAFLVLVPCACFNQTTSLDGDPVCFSAGTDFRMECPPPGSRYTTSTFEEYHRTRFLAFLTVVIYAGLIPISYAGLLFTSRHAIQRGPPTALSQALRFLHAEYVPRSFWWELVETGRKVVLTGFLAPLMPG